MIINAEDTINNLRRILWKTKRSLEDLPFDNEIDCYYMNEKYRERILSRINKILGVKEKSNKKYDS